MIQKPKICYSSVKYQNLFLLWERVWEKLQYKNKGHLSRPFLEFNTLGILFISKSLQQKSIH